MTHDELLAEIRESVRYIETLEIFNQGGWLAGAKALLAVVELHKPMNIGETLTVCRECFVMWENTPYPCATIQIIEKELA